MTGFAAKSRLKAGLFLACLMTASVSLAACSDIDSLFGGDSEDISAADAPAPTAGSDQTAQAQASFLPQPAQAQANFLPQAPQAPGGVQPLAPGAVPVATITPVTIEGGPDTGTAVNKTIQSLRNQMAGIEQKLAANAQHLADLRNNGGGAASAYQQAKAVITTRLQVGTTKGNPELVAQWNAAQADLDALSANINQLNALGTDISNDSSSAHFVDLSV